MKKKIQNFKLNNELLWRTQLYKHLVEILKYFSAITYYIIDVHGIFKLRVSVLFVSKFLV